MQTLEIVTAIAPERMRSVAGGALILHPWLLARGLNRIFPHPRFVLKRIEFMVRSP